MKLRRLLTIEVLIPLFVLGGLAVAGVFFFVASIESARRVLAVTLSIGALPFVKDMLESLWRKEFGIDLIAAVGIISSLLIGEYLAGCVILLMLSGGEALETYAIRRARKELSNLLSRAPTIAHRKHDEALEDISADQVTVGDVLLVKQGEIIPVDGVIVEGNCSIDESALTGESVPVEKGVHAQVMSGSVTSDGVITVRALKPSSDSRYEQIIRLVKEAENQKAPFVRLADRYSVWFTLTAFSLAFTAWFLSHDVVRALSVLVVATPCPLILAVPIAFSSGISRAAKRGIIIKYGEVIEKLAVAKSILLDKTGTLTLGVPSVQEVHAIGSHTKENVLQLCASLDQFSAHVLAKSLIAYAKQQSATLFYPEEFTEHIGSGVMGRINGTQYLFGKKSFLEEHHIALPKNLAMEHEQNLGEGRIAVYLATRTAVIGSVCFADQIRPGMKELFARLQEYVPRVVMATGDKRHVAEQVAVSLGITEIKAECLPEDKLHEVERLAVEHGPVVMVGDGINDAPALAAADVGITLGNITGAAQAGDVIITVDSFDRVLEVFAISKRVLAIALQCIIIGIGLSILLMLLATLGYVRPVTGALLQEIIDVIVILNALRVHSSSA